MQMPFHNNESLLLAGVKFSDALDWVITDADCFDKATLIGEELGTELKLARPVEKQLRATPIFSQDFHFPRQEGGEPSISAGSDRRCAAASSAVEDFSKKAAIELPLAPPVEE